MALLFTVTYNAPLRANYDALELLPESGRMRDANGNSYSRDELESPSSLSSSFAASVDEGAVHGHTVGEVLDILSEERDAIIRAFLFSEEDTVVLDHVEVSLPADPDRAAYGEGSEPFGHVWVVDASNVVVDITSERDDSETVGSAGEI